ncbi:MAG TPA: pyridoxal-phosphate dependent enzyme [Acidimicrobiia bacterium]|nr:pyridoxal-phosphate dependent enzyme [Acidimicrobiia bacterium]
MARRETGVSPVAYGDVLEASRRIAPHVHRTPTFHSRSLDTWVDGRVALKAENLQRVGAFKMRGATNAVMQLSDEEARAGVAAHSSGNHAQALALAAQLRGIPARIVMPSDAPLVKKDAVAGYGAEIIECEPTQVAREDAVAGVVAETGATEIHPYDNDRIIAGAGTAALELLGAAPELEVIIAPVGGGGLLSGTCLAAHGVDASIKVVGAEPLGADDAARSLAAGRALPQDNPQTMADGLRTGLSDRTFAIISAHVDQISTVTEDEIVEAMRFVWTRTKLLIEPSAAVAVAVARKLDLRGKRTGIILSGGNVDLDALPW